MVDGSVGLTRDYWTTNNAGTFTARPLLAVRHSRCHPPGQTGAAGAGCPGPGERAEV